MKKPDRKLTVLVYMSARSVIPEFARLGVEVGQEIAARGYYFTWGAGDAGLMGTTAEAAFLSGAETFGVAHGGLARVGHEAPTRHATINMVPDNFPERIRLMQSSGDAAIILPGGFGSYQELERLLKGMEEGVIQPIPVVLISPPIAHGNFYDNWIAQLQERVRRGLIKPWVAQYIKAVPTVEKAFAFVDQHYAKMTNTQWNAQKSQQLIHRDEFHAQVATREKPRALRHLKLNKKFVAVIGSEIGQSQVNPLNAPAFDSIPHLMDIIESAEMQVVCLNSNRGLAGDIAGEAARRGVLAMTLATKAHGQDGRLDFERGHDVMHATFDNAAQLSGWISRNCSHVFAMPGSDDVLIDLASDLAIAEPNTANLQVNVYNADGSMAHMLKQIAVMEEPVYAEDHQGRMIGLASQGIMGSSKNDREPMVNVANSAEQFISQAFDAILFPRHHYEARFVNKKSPVDIPGYRIANTTQGLNIVRTILHGPDVARPRPREARKVAEILKESAVRRRELARGR